MGPKKFLQFLRILILVWLPVTAPYAAINCPAHKDMGSSSKISDKAMVPSDHCEHHDSQIQEDGANTCDCPACALSSIPPVVTQQVAEKPINEVSFVAIRYRSIHLKLDTPPPQL